MVTKVFDAHVGLIDLVYIVAYVALQVLLCPNSALSSTQRKYEN